MVIVLARFGIISVLLALVPVVAISPILLYIGMLIGAQAFQTTPVKHAPAIVLALTPHLAARAKLQIDTMLGSTMNAAATVGGMAADKADAVKAAAIAALPQQGVFYHGLEVMGGGSILGGLILVRSASSSSSEISRRHRPSRWSVPCLPTSASCMVKP